MTDMRHILEDEQAELLRNLVEAHRNVTREQRQDFLYEQALTRTKGARPYSDILEAFNTGGSVSFGGNLWMSISDIPQNYDRDFVVHPGFFGSPLEVLQSDIDTLKYHDFIHFRDDSHFYITPRGLQYCADLDILAAIPTEVPMPTDRRLLFISHKETDRAIAEKLVELVQAALKLEDEEILCTSVPGHKLLFGPPITEQLKSNLNTATVLIALLTEESIKATWVLFELGAAWASGKLIIPILGPGLRYKDLPGPIGEAPGLLITDEDAAGRLLDALTQIGEKLAAPQKTGGKVTAKLQTFVDTFRAWKSNAPRAGPSSTEPPVSSKMEQPPVEQSVSKGIQQMILREVAQNYSALEEFKKQIVSNNALTDFARTMLPYFSTIIFHNHLRDWSNAFGSEDISRIHSIYANLDRIAHAQSEMRDVEKKTARISESRVDLARRNMSQSSMAAGLQLEEEKNSKAKDVVWMQFLNFYRSVKSDWETLKRLL